MISYRILLCVSFISILHFKENYGSTSLSPYGNEKFTVFHFLPYTQDIGQIENWYIILCTKNLHSCTTKLLFYAEIVYVEANQQYRHMKNTIGENNEHFLVVSQCPNAGSSNASTSHLDLCENFV